MNMIKDMPIIASEDIANAAVYVLSTPPHVQVSLKKIYIKCFIKINKLFLLDTRIDYTTCGSMNMSKENLRDYINVRKLLYIVK